ncbi:MAG: GAF domain-containing protein [Nitrospira sp. CR1.2]|nr:GAF domain-containing protein [Nitrospira sp. CR1.2]
MAVVRRKIARSSRKTTAKKSPAGMRRKIASRTPAPVREDRLLQALQQALFKSLSHSEGEGRSPIGVAAVFVQSFLQLTKVHAIAVYVRDEQTRDMTCLAEAGGSDASVVGGWQAGLTQAEQQARISLGDLQGIRLHRIGRMDGVVMFQAGKSQRVPSRAVLSLLTAIEPWLSVLLDHARLTVKYAAKILRIQHMEQVSDLLNSALGEQDKLRRALDAAIRLVEAEAGALFLGTSDGSLRLSAIGGERAAGLTAMQSSIAAGVHRTGQAVLITQGAQDARLPAGQGWQAVLPVASLVSVPVRMGARAVGVLEVVNRRSGKPFSNWDVLELASLSNQFGLAIDNLRRGSVNGAGAKDSLTP